MQRSIPATVRAAIASAAILSTLLGTTSCTYTFLALTPVAERRPAQYKWLIADAAITTGLLVPGLLVENDTAKIALLSGAALWGGITLLLVPLMSMPDRQSTPTSTSTPTSNVSH